MAGWNIQTSFLVDIIKNSVDFPQCLCLVYSDWHHNSQNKGSLYSYMLPTPKKTQIIFGKSIKKSIIRHVCILCLPPPPKKKNWGVPISWPPTNLPMEPNLRGSGLGGAWASWASWAGWSRRVPSHLEMRSSFRAATTSSLGEPNGLRSHDRVGWGLRTQIPQIGEDQTKSPKNPGGFVAGCETQTTPKSSLLGEEVCVFFLFGSPGIFVWGFYPPSTSKRLKA